MKTNDLKKGARVRLSSGWYATLMDNKKGNIRLAEVEGRVTEIGSIYSHDIVEYRDSSCYWHSDIEYTKDQLNCKAANDEIFG
jgi:hypothetical protein